MQGFGHPLRDLVRQRVIATGGRADARLFTGPRGGRITTAVLRDATHWDAVVAALGFEHLRRHALRHTGLTWMADARRAGARPAEDRRPRFAHHHAALPAPGRGVDLGGR